MADTNSTELMEAIERFKNKYGIKTPLDMFKLDEIIEEIRAEKKGKK